MLHHFERSEEHIFFDGSKRCQNVPKVKGTKWYKTVQNGTKWYKKVQKDTKRKIQKDTKRYEKVQKAAKRYRKLRKGQNPEKTTLDT